MFATSQWLLSWGRHRIVKSVNCCMHVQLSPDDINVRSWPHTGPLYPVPYVALVNVRNIDADLFGKLRSAIGEKSCFAGRNYTLAVMAVTETIERLSAKTETSSLRQFRQRKRNWNSVGLYIKPNITHYFPKILDPTQPNSWANPAHVHVCLICEIVSYCSELHRDLNSCRPA
jgi:hypothetical protein